MEHKKTLLYICTNDGSDMRINKELRTLSSNFAITYIGIGQGEVFTFGKQYCHSFHLIKGKRNNPFTILKLFLKLIQLKLAKYDSVHVVNEKLIIFLYPIIFHKHLVVDIFDSIFLINNKSRNKNIFLKKILYAPAKTLLVTDENRKSLMPDFAKHKVAILPNYPYKYEGPVSEKQNNQLTILYNGWLGQNRGTEFIYKCLAADTDLHVIMAGWIADETSKKLLDHPQVIYKGIMKQDEVLQLAATDCDYILCVYAPINENNINASPNKIYDSIQTRTPIITNAEVVVAQFVATNEIGVVIDNYYHFDAAELLHELRIRKNQFVFNDTLRTIYTWENVEGVLLAAHSL